MGFAGPRPAPVGGEPPALTDGHVVAAVRESRVPVAELGLVAAAGALGLTGHRVGHGCEGGGPGSARSLTALPDPTTCRPFLCRAVWAGPPGRPRRGHHGTPYSFPPRLGTDTPVCPHRHCLLHIRLSRG